MALINQFILFVDISIEIDQLLSHSFLVAIMKIP